MGIHITNGEIAYSDPQEQFHIERYLKIASIVKNKNVLDVGSAEGWGSYVLAKEAQHVTVVDIDGSAVERARKNFPIKNADYIEGSVCKLPFPDASFDVVAACELIEHITEEEQEAMLSEIARVLKPGGTAAISTPDKNRSIVRAMGKQYPGHVRELSLQQLLAMIRKHLTVDAIYGQDIGRKMFFRHVQKRALRMLGRGFDYTKVDFTPHSITEDTKVSYVMVFAKKSVTQ
jgi:ubiquinone/menaquinone biosynthesis C-methylase UbiE